MHFKVALPNVDLLGKRLKVGYDSFSAFVPRHNVVHLKNYIRVSSRRSTGDTTFEVVSTHNEKAQPIIDPP